jgi:hypothetical protein
MKTKIAVLKKTLAVSCLFLLLFFNDGLSAQIIYTDIVPDATPNASYPLDLNNDTVVDFIIHFGGSTGTIAVMCEPQNTNAYAGEVAAGFYLPWALSASGPICASLTTWYGGNNPGTMGLGASTGYWPGATDKYLALRLTKGLNTYYGWARFDFLAMSGSFTIKDYAYNSSPNACIQAGQIVLGMNESTTTTLVSIFPNPFSSVTTIETPGNLKNASLTVYDLYGRLVKHIETSSGQKVSLFRDNLKSGIYFMQLSEGNIVIATEKFVISD